MMRAFYRRRGQSGGRWRLAAGRPTTTVAGPYHGNVRSKVYHAPGCADYNCKNCTLVFTTKADAEKAGYRAHAACVAR
jgi:xanthine dehydrogenase iron-sulfur cluster and FAD-binding subunit A